MKLLTLTKFWVTLTKVHFMLIEIQGLLNLDSSATLWYDWNVMDKSWVPIIRISMLKLVTNSEYVINAYLFE